MIRALAVRERSSRTAMAGTSDKDMQIKFEQLMKKFGDKTAVDIPEFLIGQGEILGLVGNNGAGKTTFFRLLLDLVNADSGRILISDKEIEGEIEPSKTEVWKQFTGAYIDEGFLIDFLTAEEYLEFISTVNNQNGAPIETQLEDFKTFMGNEILGQKKLIRDFSAGNKQKIGIISAMFTHLKLIILDEPFNFLDPSSQNILKKILLDYNQKTGATIIVSSHNLQHTVEISTRIALLEHGRIIKDLPNNNRCAEKELEEYFSI